MTKLYTPAMTHKNICGAPHIYLRTSYHLSASNNYVSFSMILMFSPNKITPPAYIRIWCVTIPNWTPWTFLMAYSTARAKATAIKHLLDSNHSQQEVDQTNLFPHRLYCTFQVSVFYASLKSVYWWHTVHHIGWMQNIWQWLICYIYTHNNEPQYDLHMKLHFREVLYKILHVLANTDIKYVSRLLTNDPHRARGHSFTQLVACLAGVNSWVHRVDTQQVEGDIVEVIRRSEPVT
jgi:hypothetical protein